MLDIVIKKCNPNDGAVLDLFIKADKLYDQLYPEECNKPVFSNDFLKKESLFLVAIFKNNIIGCGGVIRKSKEWAEIKRMYIEPEYRLNKIGSNILEIIIKWSIDKNISTLRLETGIYQSEAISLYRKYSFHQIKNFDDYLNNPNSLFFEKDLSHE